MQLSLFHRRAWIQSLERYDTSYDEGKWINPWVHRWTLCVSPRDPFFFLFLLRGALRFHTFQSTPSHLPRAPFFSSPLHIYTRFLKGRAPWLRDCWRLLVHREVPLHQEVSRPSWQSFKRASTRSAGARTMNFALIIGCVAVTATAFNGKVP